MTSSDKNNESDLEESVVERDQAEDQNNTGEDSDQESSEQGAQGETVNDEGSDASDNNLADMSQEDLVTSLIAARDQINEMKDGFLRAKAEMENVRRRTQNEIINARKFAVEGFAQELLHVKDSLDQAALVELDESESEAVVKMNEGLGLTLKQLEAAFAKFSVVEVEAGPGVKFNPEHHQAISMLPSEDIESDHIINVMQKGFLIKDRLLRPAMVAVAS